MPPVAEPPTNTTKLSEGIPQSEETKARAAAISADIFDDAPEEDEVDETKEPNAPKKDAPEKEEVQREEEPEKDSPVEDRIATAVEEAFRRVGGKPKEEAQPEVKLSPEQEDELLARWKPDEKFLELLDSEDPKVRLNAVMHMRDGVIKQALTMTKFLVDQAVEGIRGEVTPLRQQHQMTAQERGRETFFSKYPALKGSADEDYTDFLQLAAQDLKAEGFVPKSNDDAMQAIATRAAQRIKKFKPNFELGTASAQTTKPKAKTTMPKQPTTSVGGGGGTASGATSASPGNRTNGAEVFD